MEAMFGTSKTPAQRMKEYQRSIKRSIRDIDRERTGLERQEKKLMADIKKEAKANRIDTARIMAKDLVRTGAYVKKMYKMKSHMEAISLRLQTMQSSQQMTAAMKGVVKVMGKMNQKMNIPQIQAIMAEFEKQNEIMGMKDEMMGDAMDEAFNDDDDDEEENSIVDQVLAELDVVQKDQMAVAPTTSAEASSAVDVSAGEQQPAAAGGGDPAADDLDKELQKRLDNLRRT
jgi:charged multivesicular body protein 2A